MTALGILTSLTIVLLIGLLASALAVKLKIPDIIFLIGAGILMGSVPYEDSYLLAFPEIFLTSISILALAIIIFDSTSKLKLKEFDDFSIKGIKLALIFLALNLIFLPFLTKYFFGLPISMGLLFASIMMGTSPEITLSMLGGAKQRTIEILKLESIINTPLTVLFPVILLELMQDVKTSFVGTVVTQLAPFLTKFASGIGSGVLVGIILFKILKKQISSKFAPLTVLVAALLSYVLAENIGGSGVLAVTTLGVFVGNIYAKEKKKKIGDVMTFESQFAKALYILVFVLIGFIIKIPLDLDFLLGASILFLAYLLIRYFAVQLSFEGKADQFTFKEKIFMTLNMPKGIAVAVVAFTLATYNNLPGISTVLDLTLLFMLATIILSAIATFFAEALVGEAPKIEK